MNTHDDSGQPLLLTMARAPALISHYLAAEGYAEAKFTLHEGFGSVAIAVLDVPIEALGRVQEHLRKHCLAGVDLAVVVAAG